ncbi:cysteine--tRNA ligase [Gammaproteobacteria bacterium]|nr:cysteine--tRNA ligase [Gammaproteobacteria bacterium]MDA8720076.1 cysteine--tRNA ligase [bacterium]MDA8924545.1 cysteine--tRNA ligase [Gammaproteobacteria bacterium]MDA9340821.1 cysteine--tRNA ligase [Gammaproteobacteria bacterium]MDC0014708.1 cysteine--tRNA ligase [Gammaproteobacteria bacterium]|tara:strand:+ start:1484 stop:2854 length:1371 start_codon:yes stop_codon:yes gene_type:complete
MTLRFYSSLTNTKEDFVPINEGEVGIYVCGMTVYDSCHLGHARAMMAFDILVKYLKYQGYKVNFIRNITDIDDKIIERAMKNNELIGDLTQRTISSMHEDFLKLGLDLPTFEPKATDHIPGMIEMIESLIEKGHAYHSSGGDVFFAVRTFPEYGKLSNKNIDDLNPGSRVVEDESKKDPLDFVLWKSAKEGEPFWDSPWGKGRPGWHIECSVMSLKNLGEHFDIHGGGPDLLFPHHENEIAQSECSSGKQFANYWLHSGLLKINGEKMSKSLGNFAMLKDLFTSYHPEVLRYYLVSSHYRSSLNFDQESLNQAKSALTRLYQTLASIEGEGSEYDQDMVTQFSVVMNDDLNTPEALSLLFQLAKLINSSEDPGQIIKYGTTLKKLSGVLGLLQDDPKMFFQFGAAIADQEIEQQIALRNTARDEKDFETADKIRDSLTEQGIILDDSSEGTTWKKS